jgi:hypothetical protein
VGRSAHTSCVNCAGCSRLGQTRRITGILADPAGDVPQQLRPLVSAMLSAEKPRSVLVCSARARPRSC